ncbi:flagellar biosynthetic protein FliR [Thermanaeromonas toyohensis ToBE]|uniref:Flagellar biosynthetic protein FliR n=1 Tax=Thermanaeromonas toyohensis ToBE TaxID=698762 RepID=A0A1W1VTF4_9FIRM|nr:flagellar biosynthetic protein FliR [Thermanaeromonas toyohensis]SMB96639.1 flagellar biosynthetic protein FliR [Thermanaeromonas toyohensis ToBE]
MSEAYSFLTWKFALVFCRAAGLVWAAPVIGSPMVPAPARAALSLFLALAAYPLVPESVAAGPLAAAGEVMFGLAAGTAARLALEAAGFVGGVWDVQAGLGMANLLDPATGQGVSLLGGLLTFGSAAVFVAGGGVETVLAGLLFSFEALPPGGPPMVSVAEVWLRVAPAFFALAVSSALPVVLVLLVVDAFLGITGRTAPQVNVFSIGFALRLAVLFLVLVAVLPHVLHAVSAAALEWATEFWKGFAG